MKYSIGLAAAALALVTTASFAGETLDRVMAAGKLVMSTDPEYPPQSALDENNDFVGFDIEVGREIAKRLGVEIEFITPGWDVITAGNWAARWDVSVGSMTPTPARAEVLDFPAIYYFTPAALAVHADSTATSAADLNGKAIGVGVATTYESYLKGDLVIDAVGAPAFTYDLTGADIHTYDTDSLALDDLRLGNGTRLDGAVTALPTIDAAIKAGYPIKVVGAPLFMEPLSVAIDKGDAEFGAKLTEIVAAMHADGTMSALSMQFYGIDLSK